MSEQWLRARTNTVRISSRYCTTFPAQHIISSFPHNLALQTWCWFYMYKYVYGQGLRAPLNLFALHAPQFEHRPQREKKCTG